MTARFSPDPPSTAYDAVCAALEARARKTARAVIKDRAKTYAREPWQLDAIRAGFSKLSPTKLVFECRILQTIAPAVRYFGLGGEVPAINLRGAILFGRHARAKARQAAKRVA